MFEKKLLDLVLRRIEYGSITIKFWDGTSINYGKGSPKTTVTIKKAIALRRCLRNLSLGFARSFIAGDIEVNPSPSELMAVVFANPKIFLPIRRLNQQTTRLARITKVNRLDLLNLHYELGNEFFRRLLGKHMMYSIAEFGDVQMSLDKAQEQKFENLANQLKILPKETVFDVGSGWGALSVYLAGQVEAQVTAITPVESQIAYSEKLAKAQGVQKLIKFYKTSHEDFEAKDFDVVIALETLEPIGRHEQGAYIQYLANSLKPGGRLLLQFTSYRISNFRDPFIDRYIFPGSYISPLPEVLAPINKSGLTVQSVDNYRQDAVKTFEKWMSNLKAVKPWVIEQYGQEFYNMFYLYLTAVKPEYEIGNLDVWRIIASKPD